MIGILDYGMGNLGSVRNACAFLELDADLIRTPAEMAGCSAVILPGVGGFADCMRHLEGEGFLDPIRSWIADDKPFLGICLGLQILFESSEEAPEVPGLAVLKGRVRKFEEGPGRKVPQIGWNRVEQIATACPLFDSIPSNTHFYFVHSYFAEPAEPNAVAGVTGYGKKYASVVWRNKMMAVQFHPEKSQRSGLQLLRNFNVRIVQPANAESV